MFGGTNKLNVWQRDAYMSQGTISEKCFCRLLITARRAWVTLVARQLIECIRGIVHLTLVVSTWFRPNNDISDQNPFMPNGVMASASSPWLASREEFCTFIRLLILCGTVCRSQHSLYENKMNLTTKYQQWSVPSKPNGVMASASSPWLASREEFCTFIRLLILYGTVCRSQHSLYESKMNLTTKYQQWSVPLHAKRGYG